MENKFQSKVVQINDIIEWYTKGELNYSPKYQRNSVWTQNAKSYLIDTILRGFPIPPIFLRQKIDVNTRKTTREVIDGQQRLRAIIDYVYEEEFPVMMKHNSEYGNMIYSNLDDETKSDILNFQIIAQIVTEDDDSSIYDMFARLNSNNVALNKQELRNSVYWGDFKVFIYQLTSDYRYFFEKYNFFKDKEYARMNDYEFMNSLIILINEGVVSETPSMIDTYYGEHNESFSGADFSKETFKELTNRLDDVFEKLGGIYLFNNKNYFYSLFAILLSTLFREKWSGIRDFNFTQLPDNFEEKLTKFISNYNQSREKDSILNDELQNKYERLIGLHSKRTTNRPERLERIKLLAELLGVQ